MRCSSVGHIPCSPSSWFSGTKSPAAKWGCIFLAFKAHFLLLHKGTTVKWTVSSSQQGKEFFGCFIEPQLDEKPWKPKAIFWILRNPFLPSSRAALIPWDSGSGVLAVWRWAVGGVFSFIQIKYLQKLPKAAPLCSFNLFRKKMVCLQGKLQGAIFFQQADCSQSSGQACPAVPERTMCTCWWWWCAR